MQLFFIRHGETEHNIAGLLAGVTDSKLTNHGVLQTQRLAQYLVKARSLRFTQLYASDLERAFMTAEEICKAQNEIAEAHGKVEVVKLELLREQDFGSLELVQWSSKRAQSALKTRLPQSSDPDFKPKETPNAMTARADTFLDNYIVPLFALIEDPELCVAVVSHGLFLGSLWRALLARLNRENVTLSPEILSISGNRPIDRLPGWTNTGFLELEIKSGSPADVLSSTTQPITDTRPHAADLLLKELTVIVQMVNGKEHLLNFKRPRGGLGSVTFDRHQTKLEGFFKKSKVEHTNNKKRDPDDQR